MYLLQTGTMGTPSGRRGIDVIWSHYVVPELVPISKNPFRGITCHDPALPPTINSHNAFSVIGRDNIITSLATTQYHITVMLHYCKALGASLVNLRCVACLICTHICRQSTAQQCQCCATAIIAKHQYRCMPEPAPLSLTSRVSTAGVLRLWHACLFLYRCICFASSTWC